MQGDKRELMEKLARRAKWRKFFTKWKKIIVITLLLAIGTPCFLAFTPWFPQHIYDGIAARKVDPKKLAENPKFNEVNPEAVKAMYDLGMFYSSTMRKNKALECWNTICNWYYGIDIIKYATMSGDVRLKKKEYLKARLKFTDDQAKAYVGYSLYRMAEHYDLKRAKQRALYIYEKMYLTKSFKGMPGFEDKPFEDKEFNKRIKIFIRKYYAGG